MLIKKIKHYLSEHQQAAVSEMSSHLQQDKEVVLHALRMMEQKGLVRAVKQELPCKGCSCGTFACTDDRIYMKI
jgi:Mn-dependent DtxR family transcriptional regulator